MYFTIPKRYKNPVIILALLREKLREWNESSLKKAFKRGKVHDNEVEEDYYRIEQNFKSIEDFCQRPPFKFVVKQGDEIKVYSDGPEIFYDDNKKRVCFEKVEFFPVPKTIQKRIFKVINSLLWKLENVFSL